jgi:hypothetical protein
MCLNLVAMARNHGDVRSIVKWCNKEDPGFEGRIQDDVIFADVETRLSKVILMEITISTM